MKTLPLREGSRIGVFSPSGPCNPARLARGVEVLRRWGFEPVLCPHQCAPRDYLAGSDEERLRALTWALGDPDLDAAWMTRGGYGITRLLPQIPWEELKPRPLVGFSDATALHYSLWRRGWTSLVHGSMLHSLADHPDEPSREGLRTLLSTGAPPRLGGYAALRAEGPLVGGNLCILAALCGTPEHPGFENALLLLEDVTERPYRLDRYFQQMVQAGALEGARGVVLGEFHRCEPERWLQTPEEVLLGAVRELALPVAHGVGVGHWKRNLPFLYGHPYRIGPQGVEPLARPRLAG